MNISAGAIGTLTVRACPRDYRLRTLRPGDEVHLPELMVSAGVGWTPFDAPGMTEYLEAPDRLEGSYVVETQGRLAALCFATRRDEVDPAWGQLDYVCVRPGHRGARLAFRVCAAVLRYQRRRVLSRLDPDHAQGDAPKPPTGGYKDVSKPGIPSRHDKAQSEGLRDGVPGAGLAAARKLVAGRVAFSTDRRTGRGDAVMAGDATMINSAERSCAAALCPGTHSNRHGIRPLSRHPTDVPPL